MPGWCTLKQAFRCCCFVFNLLFCFHFSDSGLLFVFLFFGRFHRAELVPAAACADDGHGAQAVAARWRWPALGHLQLVCVCVCVCSLSLSISLSLSLSLSLRCVGFASAQKIYSSSSFSRQSMLLSLTTFTRQDGSHRSVCPGPVSEWRAVHMPRRGPDAAD